MSVFLHGNDHIDLLVSYALQPYLGTQSVRAWITTHSRRGHRQDVTPIQPQALTHEAALDTLTGEPVITATQLGQVLLAQNVRSLLHRYEDEDAESVERMHQAISSYRFCLVRDARLRKPDVFARAIIKACSSYRYQAGESNDLDRTHAGQWITAIYEHAVNRLTHEQPGDVPAWSYTRP